MPSAANSVAGQLRALPHERYGCEVLVVGAGPGGIAAAIAAAESGQEVVVLDNLPSPGGQIWREEHSRSNHNGRGKSLARLGDARAGQAWLTRLRKSGARVLSGTTVFGQSETGAILAEIGSSNSQEFRAPAMAEVSWQKLIVATGGREVFLPFPGWTLPGVVGPGGLHAMAKAGWPVQGQRIVVAGSGPLLLAAAAGLRRHGAEVVVVAEQAPRARMAAFALQLLRFPAKLAQALAVRASLARVPYRCGCWPIQAQGNEQIERVTLTDGSKTWTEQCDYLACAFHMVPNLELPMLLGCAIVNGSVQVGEFQETSVRCVYAVGESAGVGGAAGALVQGRIAGLAASGKGQSARSLFGRRSSCQAFRIAMNRAFALRPELKQLANPDTIVCRCEDIRQGELAGFEDWRAAKLQTRCGMGPCQGRICGTAANILFGWQFSSVRPPIFPVRTGALLSIGSCPSPKNNAKYLHAP